jgi:dienelactone hydrolase|tara:strand:- start:454 stop:1383 length:930 start_codon:yes stop_codon:yes gene_type:complete
MKLKSGDDGNIFYQSSSPFEFYDIFNGSSKKEQEVFGTLVFPEAKKKTYPLVICMHGSMGWAMSSHDHSVNFLENGFAIFKVQSFESRNVTSIVEDQVQVTVATAQTDCFEALKILSNHPDIETNNIFIAGWSFGGSTAIYSAWEPIAEKLAPNGERFKAFLAFYPGAYMWPEEMRWSKQPILSLIGKDDDYTPSSLIEELSPAINEAGGNSSIILYEDSHHSFDRVDPVTYLPNAVALSKKHSIIKKDGSQYYDGEDGVRYEMNTVEGRIKLIQSGLAPIGAHLGCNWKARRASMKDSLNFLKENLDD